jgi:hypothetical protein
VRVPLTSAEQAEESHGLRAIRPGNDPKQGTTPPAIRPRHTTEQGLADMRLNGLGFVAEVLSERACGVTVAITEVARFAPIGPGSGAQSAAGAGNGRADAGGAEAPPSACGAAWRRPDKYRRAIDVQVARVLLLYGLTVLPALLRQRVQNSGTSDTALTLGSTMLRIVFDVD